MNPRRTRASLIILALTLDVATGRTQVSIRALTDTIRGHNVGGVTIDLVGNIYVADFGDLVWKITPDGTRSVFAEGLYGASGNAVDNDGSLLQANYYGNSITRIDRRGQTTAFVTRGLSGPVGIAVDKETGDAYVANCRGNSIAKIARDGTASPFARGDLLSCPNGIAFGRDMNLYVVNFRNNKMLKVDRSGVVTPFATISDKGLGHLCFKNDRFYVTAYESHVIYEVGLDATVKPILGNGERGIVDGVGDKARLSFPNGIACSPWTPRLYINEVVDTLTLALPPRAIVREILLGGRK
jgi:DNA-binding beta-propeller fold protein YncE